MSENEIKPVAWVDLDMWIATNDAGDSFFTDYQDDDTVAVYDQSAIDRLTAERDAAVADAQRYRWIRLRIGGREAVEDDFKWEYESGECLAQEVDAAIDAAMQHASDGGAT